MARLLYILACLLAIDAACSCSDGRGPAAEVLERALCYCLSGEFDSLRACAGLAGESGVSVGEILDAAADGGPQAYAVAIVAFCPPGRAATELVTSLLAMERADSTLARKTASGIVELYERAGWRRELAEFRRSVDSTAATLTIREQARLLVLAAGPGVLGRRAKGESPRIIRAIEMEYASDEEALKAFENGLNGD